jgi:membrane protease YdiL (CAAX protease family)
MQATEPAAKKYGPGSAILVTLLAFVGIQFVIAIPIGLIVGIYIAITGAKIDEVAKMVDETTIGQFVGTLLVYLGMLAAIWLFMRYRKITWADIGLGRGITAKDIGYAILTFVGYFVLSAMVIQAVSTVWSGLDVEQEQQIGFDAASGASLVLVFISLVVLPPLVEEIMIRGFLYSGLRNRFNKWAAAIIASVLFGIAHLQLFNGAPPLYIAAIDTFVLSMVLIWLREKTGSLWAGIAVHAIKNFIAFLALFVFKTV